MLKDINPREENYLLSPYTPFDTTKINQEK